LKVQKEVNKKINNMNDFLICTRNIESTGNESEFGNEPGDACYLIVPEESGDFNPSNIIVGDKIWLTKLLAGRALTDVLVYVHGYDMDRANTLKRHRILKKGLQEKGWEGELVTFAWPSGTKPLLYWEDRFDALDVAYQLVSRCIRLLDDQVAAGCDLNVHVIAHSTGALIVRESFNMAQTAILNKDASWTTGQIVFIAGDVSAESMAGSKSDGLYIHCGRLTNYFSNYDSVLAVSSAKRLGFANRVGRVGLPKDAPQKAVDVNCSDYYHLHKDELAPKIEGAFLPHSWYFWSDWFLEDLFHTLSGNLDRNVIPTRSTDENEELWLSA
jgi:hypothetical protein